MKSSTPSADSAQKASASSSAVPTRSPPHAPKRRSASAAAPHPMDGAKPGDGFPEACGASAAQGDAVGARALAGVTSVLGRQQRLFEMEYDREGRPEAFTLTVEALERPDGGAVVILDPAPAPAAPLPSSLLDRVDVLTPNLGELQTLTGRAVDITEAGAAARRLAQGHPRLRVIVKMGEAGALLVEPGGSSRWAAPRVTVLDTTAAGDAFNGALAVALAEGVPLADAGRRAVAAASLSVTRAGAQPSMPSREEIETAVRDHS